MGAMTMVDNTPTGGYAAPSSPTNSNPTGLLKGLGQEFQLVGQGTTSPVANPPQPPQPSTPPAASSRSLTTEEQEFLFYMLTSVFPSLNKSANLQAILAGVLSQVTLHGGGDGNLVASGILMIPWTGAVTFGLDQYYKGGLPPVNAGGNKGLFGLAQIGHETVHSLQANLAFSTGLFLTLYGADSAWRFITFQRCYKDNFLEVQAYAFENTIKDFPQVFGYFKSGHPEKIPAGMRAQIRARFLDYLTGKKQMP